MRKLQAMLLVILLSGCAHTSIVQLEGQLFACDNNHDKEFCDPIRTELERRHALNEHREENDKRAQELRCARGRNVCLTRDEIHETRRQTALR